jgi:hypothetical protein
LTRIARAVAPQLGKPLENKKLGKQLRAFWS